MSAAPLRVGVIGAGNVVAAHLPVFLQFPDRLQVTAVCAPDSSRAAQVAADAGGADIYTDAARMLTEASIDAVDICTPHDRHAPLAIAAAEAGRHVLVEKPMATSLVDCQAMVDAADAAGVTLMIAQHQRFVPAYRGARRVLEAGEIGSVRAARIDTTQNLSDYYPAGHWLFDGERAGGGVVISGSVHKIDLMRYLVGEIARVTALSRTRQPDFINGAEDYAVAQLEFENGAIGELFAAYGAFRAPWGEHFAIFGEHGTIFGMTPHPEGQAPAMIASSTREAGSDFSPVEPVGDLPTENGIANEILHFADCCATGEEPLTSGRDNIRTMRVVFATYESARTGKPVETASLHV